MSLALGRPWTVEDLAPGQLEQFAASKVFLGGDAGRDTMIMVHGEEMLPGAEEIGNGEQLRWKPSPLRPGCLSRPSGGLAEAGRGSGQPGAPCGAEHERGLRSASWPRSEPPLVCTSTTPLLPLTCARAGAKGELKATLCFILPEEKMFSSYYGITCHAR